MAYILVMTTAGSRKEAQKIASVLLQERLAACIHIGSSGESHFVWKGKRECCREWVLWIKTTRACYKQLEKKITEHHSYDTPEILRIKLEGGFARYLRWVDESVGRMTCHGRRLTLAKNA